MTEIFKDVPGYEGLYQVSNLGRVKSLHDGKEKIRKPCIDPSGYYYVILCKKGIKTKYSLHRLVALVFIPNPNNYPEVNHKDENKANNQVDNLEWCTRQYNANYGTARKRRREKIRKPILCYKGAVIIKKYDAIIDVEKDGYNVGGVSRCLHNKRKSYKGLTWTFS